MPTTTWKNYQGAVWVDRQIRDWAEQGNIDPYDPKRVQAASLDLTLSNQVRMPNPRMQEVYTAWRMFLRDHPDGRFDAGFAQEIQMRLAEIGSPWAEPVTFNSIVFGPGDFCLFSSHECIRLPPTVASLLVLKSTPGRLAVNHSHSGWGDPGFGYPHQLSSWTFELSHIGGQGFAPIVLRPGMSIMQMVFLPTAAVPTAYYGEHRASYTGQTKPEPAREGLRYETHHEAS